MPVFLKKALIFCFAGLVALGLAASVWIFGIHALFSAHYAPYQRLQIVTGIQVSSESAACSPESLGALRIEGAGIEQCTLNGWASVEECVVQLGIACKDGTFFVGFSTADHRPMFASPCDAMSVWSGSSCVPCPEGTFWAGQGDICKSIGDSAKGLAWNNGASGKSVTGASSEIDGRKNTDLLSQAKGAGAPYIAASYCRELRAFGHDDWYLPAREELVVADAAIRFVLRLRPAPSKPSLYLWSSTEASAEAAWFHYQGTTSGDTTGKDRNYSVLCVRK